MLNSEFELEFYKTMGVPLPTQDATERRINRMAWATFRTLHSRTCDATGKKILSMYAQDCKHPVYHTDYWWSDSWDALSYGLDFDFSKTFFEQFDMLLKAVPVMHQSVIHSENCEYVNMAGHCKDSYLCFFVDYCENCIYIQDANKCRYCLDSIGIANCELCYECIDCSNCYEVLYSNRANNCHSSYFLTDCRGCENCIGCFNLVNKKYHVFNKPVTKEQFEKIKAQFSDYDKVLEFKNLIHSMSAKYPKKYYAGHSNENFSGDNLRNCKNTFNTFNSHELENVSNSDYLFSASNCMDVTIYGLRSDHLYNCLKTGDNCSNNICCLCCWTGSSNNAYCHLILNTTDCFGCSGLKGKKYCILNKQYTKSEYEVLRAKIIEHMKKTGEWGKFFPIAMSPFAYNESIAQMYYPLDKAQAVNLGYKWRDDKESALGGIFARDMIHKDSIINTVFKCENTNKSYKIIKAELDFYEKMNIPLPRLCPEERHNSRLVKQNEKKLSKTTCSKCNEELLTTYKDIVFCEKCYLDALS